MWTKKHSVVIKDIEPQQIWKVWADINNWPEWDEDAEWTELKGAFEKGAVFHLKPKGGPKVKIEIIECTPLQSFTDCTKLPLARLYGSHRMEKTAQGLQLTTTVSIEGWLGWLWRKLIAEKIVAGLPQQYDMLIKVARKK